MKMDLILPQIKTIPRARRKRGHRAFCAAIARLAVGCLHSELVLYPKPGLVSLADNGSHRDMNAVTFMRSLFALRHYFGKICLAGTRGAPFHVLKRLGIEAEQRMLQATGGINTHRGAIFSLGLLCAAAGRAHAHDGRITALSLQSHLVAGWGQQLAAHTGARGEYSHGLAAAAVHGASGAREEGALGLPSVFGIGVPALRAALRDGRSLRQARIDTLFALMAHISDTNVVHRAGADGAQFVRRCAQQFLDQGASAAANWESFALSCHRAFVARNLSPGGAADLLAASCFVHGLTQ